MVGRASRKAILDTGDGHEKGVESDLFSEQMPKSPRMASMNGEHCLFVP